MDGKVIDLTNIKEQSPDPIKNNRVIDINKLINDIMDQVNALHSPISQENILVCDICGKEYDVEEAGNTGRSVISLDHGVFWLCEDCVQKLIVEKLENIKNWK